MSLPPDDLIRLFREQALAHTTATMEGNYRVANKAADRVNQIFRQIIALGDEGRQALVALAEVSEDEVAILAAAYALKSDPKRSLAVLQRLTSNRGIIGFKAEHAIRRWKSGEWNLE